MVSEAVANIEKLLRTTRPTGSPSDPAYLAQIRWWIAAAAPPPRQPPREVDAGGVLAEWIVPDGARTDVRIVYLHGGGYVSGSRLSHRALATRLAREAQCALLLPEYRLAPEHPFPAALDDAQAVVRFAATNGPDGGSHAARLWLAGDSAGGGLSLATACALREAGARVPDKLALISPWTDLAATGASITSRAAVDPYIPPDLLVTFAKLYAGEVDLHAPQISPLYADLHGLPPMLVHVGDNEVLLDDSTRLAARAREAGVAVELVVYEGLFHVFHAFAPLLPEAKVAIAQLGAWLRA